MAQTINLIRRMNRGSISRRCYLLLQALIGMMLIPFCVQAQWVHPDSLTPIYTLKYDFDYNSSPTQPGKKVTVAGIANVSTGLLHEVYLQTYIQNDSAGVPIFGYKVDEPILEGDSVVVKGREQMYFGQPELLVTEYRVYPRDKNPPKSLDIFEAFKNPEKCVGMAVEGTGIIKEKGYRYNGKYLLLAASDTSSQTIMLYVSNFHSLHHDFDFDTPDVGDAISVAGVLGQYDAADPDSMFYKVFMRDTDDFSYAGLPRHYLKLIGMALLAVVLFVAVWTTSLRIKVQHKTEELEKSVSEKKALIQEIHHRVKNNLAAISGILELQCSTTESREVQEALRESQARIRSMVMVHEKLYQSVSLKSISMKTYLGELSESISNTFAGNASKVNVITNVSEVELDRDTVIPLGLLVNELIVNAYKHAFKGRDKGTIEIMLKENEDHLLLKVKDDGVGLPHDLDPAQTDSLGMVLIDIFSQQLNAERTIENTVGTCFTFRFPADSNQR